jgi:hypothetical protein
MPRKSLEDLDTHALIALLEKAEDEIVDLWGSDDPSEKERIATLMQQRSNIVSSLTGLRFSDRLRLAT